MKKKKYIYIHTHTHTYIKIFTYHVSALEKILHDRYLDFNVLQNILE